MGKEIKVSLAAGSIGKSFTTHGENIGLGDMAEIAKHSRLTPEEAREQLIELVKAIPDYDLENYVAAQVTVVC